MLWLPGNKFTVWGTRKEPVALDHYQQATGYEVSSHGLKLLGNDSVHSWIGASPDGIVTPDPQSSRALAPQFVGKGNGVLEVKCPHGRDPSTAHPGEYLRDYYYAQVGASEKPKGTCTSWRLCQHLSG